MGFKALIMLAWGLPSLVLGMILVMAGTPPNAAWPIAGTIVFVFWIALATMNSPPEVPAPQPVKPSPPPQPPQSVKASPVQEKPQAMSEQTLDQDDSDDDDFDDEEFDDDEPGEQTALDLHPDLEAFTFGLNQCRERVTFVTTKI